MDKEIRNNWLLMTWKQVYHIADKMQADIILCVFSKDPIIRGQFYQQIDSTAIDPLSDLLQINISVEHVKFKYQRVR